MDKKSPQSDNFGFEVVNHNHGSEQDDDQLCRKSTLQKFTKDVFISTLRVVNFEQRMGHVFYLIKVVGKTKYLADLKQINSLQLTTTDPAQTHSNNQVAEFYIWKRYSDMLRFHKLLLSEMKSYLQKKNLPLSGYPSFPSKKLFFNRSQNFIQRRADSFNDYFDKIFRQYPLKVPYTNTLIDFCQPFKLSAAVIGAKSSGKTLLIQRVVQILSSQHQIPFSQEALVQPFKTPCKEDNGIEINKQPMSQSTKKTALTQVSESLTQFDNVDYPKLQSQISEFTSSNNNNMNHQDKELDKSNGAISNNSSTNPKVKKKHKFIVPNHQSTSQALILEALTNDSSPLAQTVKNNHNKNNITKSITKKVSTPAIIVRDAESYFPMDIPYQSPSQSGQQCNKTIFRMDMQEYQSSDSNLRPLLKGVLQNEDKNILIFTFDITSKSSFQFLKRTLRAYIYEREEMPDSLRHRKNIPLIILGMKQDLLVESKVGQDEISSLVNVIKEYVECQFLYVSNHEQEDILGCLHCMFGLASIISNGGAGLSVKDSISQLAGGETSSTSSFK